MSEVFEIKGGDLYKREVILNPTKNYCSHRRLEVDIKQELVMCLDCKERISPMTALKQMMDAEGQLHKRIEGMKEVLEKAAKKNRCKCDKCGQMTKIQRN